MSVLHYDPGSLPSLPPPPPGTTISFHLDGFPPYKRHGRSVRNPSHKHHSRFLALRRAAATIMAGRAWTHGDVRLRLVLCCPELELGFHFDEYFGGVSDALDGSHGFSFTFLPIVYEDDCQVRIAEGLRQSATESHYEVVIEFL